MTTSMHSFCQTGLDSTTITNMLHVNHAEKYCFSTGDTILYLGTDGAELEMVFDALGTCVSYTLNTAESISNGTALDIFKSGRTSL